MKEIEIWKDIKDFEGLYQVGSLGNVRSLNYNKTGDVRILRQSATKCGYMIVRLCRDGKQFPRLVSRLVCSAFHPNTENLPCVNHIDEDKHNNRADNLEWCTYSYNTLYGTHGKRMVATRNERRGPKAEKPILQLSLDGVEIARFQSISDAERMTGANRIKISLCCRGKRRTHFGYRWEFESKEEKG